ncbi:hypothetical protein J1N35_014441 [Gossypium stocksii]|uniref:Uncharacterized protein n=1 Tax=Gossypium stocksii TaxID=47602 RepID=A0A9D4A8W1_9ROSI|nr:hypothetical protein J1N35_014441 [Gossypium stocksii]
MEGRHWLFRKFVILFDRLRSPTERDQIRLTSSPFLIRIGSCPPEFDKKNLMYAIGVEDGMKRCKYEDWKGGGGDIKRVFIGISDQNVESTNSESAAARGQADQSQ